MMILIKTILVLVGALSWLLVATFAAADNQESSNTLDSLEENKQETAENQETEQIAQSQSWSSSSQYAGNNPFDDTVYYRINWAGPNLNSEIPSLDETGQEKPASETLDASTDPQTIVQDQDTLYITTSNKEKYQCILPKTDPERNVKDKKPDELSGINAAYQLLTPIMAREVCSYRLEQYWTYELCHGRFIRQYHEEATVQKTSSQEYFLGRYDVSNLQYSAKEFEDMLQEEAKEGRKRPTVTVDDAQLPYIEINMTGGTICDLNGKPRFTRVFYVCNEDSKHELYSIKETSTCEYEAIVFSPFLCIHPDFRIKTAQENDIKCYALGKSPEKPRGLREIEEATLRDIKKRDSPLGDDFKGIFEVKTKKIGAGVDDDGTVSLQFKVIFPDEVFSDPSMDKSSGNAIDAEDDKAPFARSGPSIDNKLVNSFLNGELCLTGGSGYWKHEFCYGDKVEQYHEEKGIRKATISLGKWDPAEHKKWLTKYPHKRPPAGKTPKQVSHFYSNGDYCEKTNKPRHTEVKLKCRNSEGHPDSVAIYLLEPRTCEYILGIESPLICHLLNNVDDNGLMRAP